MHDIEHLPGIFTLGYLGENEFRTIQIDLTPWLEIIPDGIASIVHIRPGETSDDAYVAATTFEDGILSWQILAEDLGEHDGYGTMQINLNGHDADNNQIAKSEVVKTKVNASAMDVSGDIPSAQQSWIDRILALLAEENTTIEEAQTIVERINNLVEGVEDMPKAYFFECDRLRRTPGVMTPRRAFVPESSQMGGLGWTDTQSFVIKLPDGVEVTDLKENDLIFIKTTADITVPERESTQHKYTIYGLCFDLSYTEKDESGRDIYHSMYVSDDILNIAWDYSVGFQLFDKDRVYVFRMHRAFNPANRTTERVFDIINFVPGLHDIVESAKTAMDEAMALVDGSKVVRYDIDQTLTNVQKARVRNNIMAAALDANGKILSSQLPSYVDDALEGYIDPQEDPIETFYQYRTPIGSTYAYYGDYTPEAGKIYVELVTQKAYRWSGSIYVEISPSIALGETANTAFPGNRGLALEQSCTTVVQTAENINELTQRAETAAESAEDVLEQVTDAVVHEPKIQNGNWFVWDFNTSTYVDTQISATGPQGVQGVQGIQGVKGDKGDKGDQGDPAPSSLVVPAVESWMEANITDDPTVVIDSSLSVSGAAADAATVGNMISAGTDGLVLTVH